MPVTHNPARHTPPHQAGRLASPSNKAKPNPNQCHTLPGQDPSTGFPPADGTAPKSGTEIQRNPSDTERAETPVQAPINPQPPTPKTRTLTPAQTPTRRSASSPGLSYISLYLPFISS
ncbi:hypothetical protein ILYODFUR_031002 [Ilyodon furcidens]|uniref:Uncharacterized protein n=1 Tax=Ilyodon furcidens TaxID=33524 RepID=A0ABV0UY13_9TELE